MPATRALITGCSSGIGRATALELTARGYEVMATARRLESLDGLDVARTIALDVDSDESVAHVRSTVGPVDVLVNNAGFGVEGAIEEVPLADVRRGFETNFFGAIRMIQAFLPPMREARSGAIVNVTSIAGVTSAPLGGFYAATKFALEAASEALWFEVGHFGIRVITVEPGAIATEFSNNVVDHRLTSASYGELARQWEGALELLRDGTAAPGPEIVARAIADALASDTPPLRLPVGGDAEMIAASRAALSFHDFQSAMRQVLKIDW
jgi:short-subunit dehydrogenase